MQFPVFIELRRSFIYSFVTCCMHGVAAVCLLAVPLDWFWHLILLSPIAGSLWFSLRPGRYTSLRLVVGEELAFLDVDGARVGAELLPESTVFTWLVVLRFKIEGQRKTHALTLLPDPMSRDEFRTLRLWLRWSAMSGQRNAPDS